MSGRVSAISIVMLLAGCARAPAQLEPPAPMPVRPLAPEPLAEAERTAVHALLERVKAASARTRNFTANAYTTMRLPDGRKDHNLARIAWKRPGRMAATVIEAAIAKKEGTKLVFDGDREVRVRTFFFGIIPIKLTLDVEDPRLVDGSKRSLRDTSTERLLATLLHPDADVRPLGPGTALGEAIDLVEVRSPLRWNGVDKDVFGISRRIDLPIVRDAYDARGRVMFHLEMRAMHTNVAIPAAEWTLD